MFHTSRRAGRLALASILVAVAAPAQSVTEIPAMTIPTAYIDMDAVGPAGPTTLAAVLAAATGGVPAIANITLTPNTAARGVYNTNPFLGRALGLDLGGLALIDPPAGGFDAFDASVDLTVPTTEFGMAIGDWVGTMILDFYLQNALVTTFTSTSFTSASGAVRFFQMTGGTFDRVDFRASSTGGNWVIAELYVPTSSGYAPFGRGCAGSNGTPTLASMGGGAPTLGQQFVVQVSNLPLNGSAFFLGFGSSSSQWPGLGRLPFDLGVIGAPGCLVLCTAEVMGVGGVTGGMGSFSFTIPNDPRLSGLAFYNQAYVPDMAANQLGLTLSNGAVGVIQ
ncbi:MAG: hypothetical protein IPM29_25000 [Planctomycetes bacterium]|nr:hypothetical protein [Planctomycetota bacterium]